MFKDNKICFLILFILLFSFLFTSFTFASSDENAYPYSRDISYLTPEQISYIASCTDVVGDYMKANNITKKYYFVISQFGNIDFINDTDRYFGIVVSNNPKIAICKEGTITFNACDVYIFNFYVGETQFRSIDYAESCSYYYAGFSTYFTNCDIVPGIRKEPHAAFFRHSRLYPLMAKVEMAGVLQEIVWIIPLILVVVVSFLGLRKALKLLSRLLHRCLII